MRLTLRTLLAYLDDTLEPLEIKRIGQKVAESDTARELVARVKKVTRRRRLTVPADSGPGQRFDANVVAEYLDNELGDDAVSELEKICLDSDVHLAEIASCHQILTLVLGQPALVPPTARARMYGLVHGREAIRTRRAAPVARAAAMPMAADGEGEDVSLLGLPGQLRSRTMPLLLPLVAVLLLAVLGVALYLAIPHEPSDRRVAAAPTTSTTSPNTNPNPESSGSPSTSSGASNGSSSNPPGDPSKPGNTSGKDGSTGATGKTPSGKTDNEGDTSSKPSTGSSTTSRPDEEDDPFGDPFKRRRPGSLAQQRTPVDRKPPGKDRVRVGSYYSDSRNSDSRSTPSILVTQRGNEWRRLSHGDSVYSSEQLVSLPGYSSEVRLKSEVRLLLRGHLPDLTPPDAAVLTILMESAVVLHPSTEDDLDLTLNRGRIYFSNHKENGPARVRLRFLDQVWVVTLEEPGSEVGIDLLKYFSSGADVRNGEEPDADAILWVMRGRVELIDGSGQHFPMRAPPGPALMRWVSRSSDPRSPDALSKLLPMWSKDDPQDKNVREAAKLLGIAMRELSAKMSDGKRPVACLDEVLQDDDPKKLSNRLLAVYAYGALDRPESLIETLGQDSERWVPERQAAIHTLRCWLSWNGKQPHRLYDPKTGDGLLRGRARYKPTEAATLFQLLQPFSTEDARRPDTYDTLADYLELKVAIAELAWWHLIRLAGGVLDPAKNPFNAAWPKEVRIKVAESVRQLVKEGKLPPSANPRGGSSSGPDRGGSRGGQPPAGAPGKPARGGKTDSGERE